MTRYADPQRCPDCRKQIEYGATSCPSCGLPLQGMLAQQLFATLTRADALIAQLRSVRPVSVPAHIDASTLPRYPAQEAPGRPSEPASRRGPRGLSAASVPRILLGLGAACVLVAALVFLAVTWSAMGVAGRTATLVGLTAVAGALAALMVRRGLRGASEALTVVALGLLSLDMFGARDSGWFGEISASGFCVLLGVLLAVVAAGASATVRRGKVAALTGSEVVSALGLVLVVTGIATTGRLALSPALVLAVLVSAGVAAAAHRLKLRLAAAGDAFVTAAAWLILVVSSLGRADDHAGVRALWLRGEAWPLLVAIAMVAALALARRLPVSARVAALAVAEGLLAGLLALPFLQDTKTETTLAVLVILIAVCAQMWSLRSPWSLSGTLTLALGSIWMLVVTGELVTAALARAAHAGHAQWSGHRGDRFSGHLLGNLPAAWLLPVAVATLVVAGVVLARATGASVAELVASPRNRMLGIAVLVAAGAATLLLYPVPVWLVLAVLLVVASVFGTWSLSRRSGPALGVSALFLAGGLGLSAHDEWFTAVALVVTVVLAGATHLRWRGREVSAGSGVLVALAVGGSVWTWGSIAGADRPWIALAGLVVLAALVLAGFPVATKLRVSDAGVGTARDRSTFVGVEVGAGVAGFTLALVGVAAAPHLLQAGWVAAYLTLAGAAVSAMALVREERRHVAWPGGALLAMATWVRLWDVGVRVPEAYTLPSAVALGAVGLIHLRRRPGSSTMTALTPGLALALVPSLLWTFREPFEIRSVLLGAGCLALLLAGLRVNWTAPVVYAATAGILLVLRLAAPFVDAAVPRWVLIGVAGAVLIGMGVTWERRLQEARQLTGYVRELR